MALNTSDLASQIVQKVQQAYGDSWLTQLSDADRNLIRNVAYDAATVTMQSLAAGSPDALAPEKRQINAQLANLAAAAAGSAADLLWQAVKDVLQVGIAFAVSAV